MPSGKTHSTATLIIATGLGVAAYQNGWPVIPLAAGALAGLVLTPDLDVPNGSISDAYMRKTGGCLVGALWSLFWMPYRKIITHRSILSHGPLIGTAIRLLYLFGLPLLAWRLLSGVVILPDLPAWWPWPVAGLVAADTTHYIMDKLFKC